jgi:hypothetical protein
LSPFIRRYNVVNATFPPVCVKVTDGTEVPATASDTSKPVGALTNTSAVNAPPVTVNDCAADAVPYSAVIAVKLPPNVTIGSAVTVKSAAV